MRSNLNLQVCFYPFFDGGFYVTGPTAYMLQFRIALWFIDFRIWWDRHKKSELGPFDYARFEPGPSVEIPAQSKRKAS